MITATNLGSAGGKLSTPDNADAALFAKLTPVLIDAPELMRVTAK